MVANLHPGEPACVSGRTPPRYVPSQKSVPESLLPLVAEPLIGPSLSKRIMKPEKKSTIEKRKLFCLVFVQQTTPRAAGSGEGVMF